MAYIAVDIGHGSNTYPPSKGVRKGGKGYAEHDFNSKLGIAIKDLLEQQGHKVIFGQQPFKPDVPLRTRTNLYNREKVDLVISLHANWNNDNNVNGRCVFYWGTSSKSKALAVAIRDEIKKKGYSTHGNGLHAGVRGSWTNLYINRETNMPAALVEHGFMGGNKDFDLIFGSKQDQYIKDMAEADVRGIQKWLGSGYKGETTVKPTPSKPVKPSTSKWTKVSGNWSGQTLRRGQHGEPVRQMQSLLASKHYYPNKGAKNNGVDGYFGADTLDAVRRYQSMHGLTVDGLPGKSTYASLKGTKAQPKPQPKPKSAWSGQVLRSGNRGSAVRQLQEMLSAKHYYPNKGAKNNGIDGIYGPKTVDAVRRYQSMHGLAVDGIAGRATYNSLNK